MLLHPSVCPSPFIAVSPCLISILAAEKTGARALGSDGGREKESRERGGFSDEERKRVFCFEREHCVVPPLCYSSIGVI